MRNPKPLLRCMPREAQTWLDEPDYRMFEASGFTCVVRRVWSGNLCGYVGLPRSHPLWGVGLRDLIPTPPGFDERPYNVDEHGVIDTFITALEMAAGDMPAGFAPLTALLSAHGGLTFAGPLYDHTGYWLGFDCGHAWDLQPGLMATLEEIERDPSWLLDSATYRTFDYTASEAATLAGQVAEWTARIPHLDAARDAIERLRASLRAE